jgi:hypothetical protein
MSGLKMWAHPTWNFFHCFANKINEDFFISNRKECLDIIKLICKALPCPDCTVHATRFMLTVNEKNIKTKADLIKMLYTFHNIVNRRTGKSPQKENILNKYDNYSLGAALSTFIQGYGKSYGSLMGGVISTVLIRRKNAQFVVNWMRKHWKQFQ